MGTVNRVHIARLVLSTLTARSVSQFAHKTALLVETVQFDQGMQQ